jgi:uridylate kinase
MAKPKYKRVLLKLSGEAFSGKEGFGIDAAVLHRVAGQIKQLREMGIQVAIVVGGGNFWRGGKAEKEGMDRVAADYAGMLATIINALSLEDTLKREGVEAVTQSALEIHQVAQPYARRLAIQDLENGKVVVFAGGTGNPYLTTDTAAALRAIEIKAEVLFMNKHDVDGIYDSDPRKNPNAKKFDKITFVDAIKRRLQVMDATALSLCLENKLPIIVFDFETPGNIEKAVLGEPVGTLVYQGE